MRLIDYLRWVELHIYMTVHELSLTCTRQPGQGPNRYIFVVVAHALLTACICYYTGAKSHTLHKQALHHILFPYAKGHWCWYVVVVVGAGSFVPILFCALPAAAELGSRVLAHKAAMLCGCMRREG
jgi:hypothetical protein